MAVWWADEYSVQNSGRQSVRQSGRASDQASGQSGNLWWYAVVAAVWVALFASDVALWGPDAEWHSYVLVFGWAALTVRRVLIDLEGLRRRTWWLRQAVVAFRLGRVVERRCRRRSPH